MDVINKIKDLFKQHGIINSTHNIPGRDTPLDDDYSKISLEPGKIPHNELDDHLDKNFASIVGALIYISITARPDLAFTIAAALLHTSRVARTIASHRSAAAAAAHFA